jgi:type VI secretion system protein ImpA
MDPSDQTVREQGVIDVESLLRPIDLALPAGRDLADENEYETIREHRRADIEIVLRDDEFDKSRRLFWKPEQKTSDWRAVVKLGCEALRTKTKDLQIAAWVAEALGHLHGFAGLRDGFRLLHQLQEQFWEDSYPRIAPDDPESRFGPYDFLNSDKVVPHLIRSLPLTKGSGGERYSHSDFASLLQNDELLRKQPEVARQSLRGPNKIVSEDWERAVAQTPRSFYEGCASELAECLESFTAWEQNTVERFPRQGPRGKSSAPSLSNIRRALLACRDIVADILPKKRALEPDAADNSGQVDTSPPAAVLDGEGAVDGLATETRTNQLTASPAAPKPPEGTVRPIADRDTAYQRLLEVVAFLRKDDPRSPTSYLLVRAYGIGELYALAGRPPDGERPGPESAVRQELRRAVADGRWEEVVELAEGALSRRDGRIWLDAYRYAIQALEATDRQSAALSCRSLVRMVLHDFPELLDTELDDGTAAADAKTRLWLQLEGLLGPPATRDEPVPSPLAESAPIPPSAALAGEDQIDITASAVALADAGQVQEAVALLDRAMAAARSGRERFLLELHLAEICRRFKNDQLALALLEDLERKIDEFRLEAWENRELCARVIGSLYDCLRARGANERLGQVYARLCKLDIRRAIQTGPGALSG